LKTFNFKLTMLSNIEKYTWDSVLISNMAAMKPTLDVLLINLPV